MGFENIEKLFKMLNPQKRKRVDASIVKRMLNILDVSIDGVSEKSYTYEQFEQLFKDKLDKKENDKSSIRFSELKKKIYKEKGDVDTNSIDFVMNILFCGLDRKHKTNISYLEHRLEHIDLFDL